MTTTTNRYDRYDRYEVISLDPLALGGARISHGSTPRYAGAAQLAKAVRLAFPNRTALVLIPKPLIKSVR